MIAFDTKRPSPIPSRHSSTSTRTSANPLTSPNIPPEVPVPPEQPPLPVPTEPPPGPAPTKPTPVPGPPEPIPPNTPEPNQPPQPIAIKSLQQILQTITNVRRADGINEESYLMQKLTRTVIITNNVDNCSLYRQSPATQSFFNTVG
jgi:hypothetical protein